MEIQTEKSATMKVRTQCNADIEKLNIKIRSFDAMIAELNSKHSLIITDLKSGHSTFTFQLEGENENLRDEIASLMESFEIDGALKERQETLVMHLNDQIRDLNLALESKDGEAQKASYDLRISMQTQM